MARVVPDLGRDLPEPADRDQIRQITSLYPKRTRRPLLAVPKMGQRYEDEGHAWSERMPARQSPRIKGWQERGDVKIPHAVSSPPPRRTGDKQLESAQQDAYRIFFHEGWYVRTYPEVPAALEAGEAESALDYFIKFGHSRQHSPGPLFCTPYYRANNSLFHQSLNIDAAHHYWTTVTPEKLAPHWLFDEAFYQARYTDIQSNIEEGAIRSAYLHFLETRRKENRRPHPLFCHALIEREYPEFQDAFADYLMGPCLRNESASPLFDVDWYQGNNADVQSKTGLAGEFRSALEHFIREGMRQGLSPLPDFDEEYYLKSNPHIAEALDNGVVPSAIHHWLFHGVEEGRNPNRFFCSNYYLSRNPLVEAEIQRMNLLGPFEHFLLLGQARGLRCHEPLVSIPVNEDSAKALFTKRAQVAEHQLAAIAPLEFPQPVKEPAVSAVIPVHNQFQFTASLLLQLHGIASDQLQVIVVDDQSTDATVNLESMVKNVAIVRTPEQLGFPGACNIGWRAAQGRNVVFLNNDIELGHQAISHAQETLESAKDIGAVGGRIIRTNGQLQESGSIVWKDGSCAGYGRDQSPTAPQYNTLRDVDFCSACFLMLPRAVLEELDGFDEEFSPGYFEEVDLSFRIWKSGRRIVCDPRVYLYHFEYASFSKGRPPTASFRLMQKHQKLFVNKHRSALAQNPPPRETSADYFADRGKRGSKRVLVIEDLAPFPSFGSGFVRTNRIVKEMLALGCHVTVLAFDPREPEAAADIVQELKGVELIHGGGNTETVVRLVEERRDLLDVVWVCRTHNGDRFMGLLKEIQAWPSPPRIILDTEAIAATRNQARAKLHPDGEWDEAQLGAELRTELRSAEFSDVVLTVNERDRDAIRDFVSQDIAILGHALSSVAASPGFEERSGFLFVGAVHGVDSPNYDSLLWFLRSVWPLIHKKLPQTKFSIVGYWHPSLPTPKLFAQDGVEHVGPVASLEPIYDSHRVSVAPTRYAGGIPFKVHEAASRGVPAVTTPILAEQLGWRNEEGIVFPPSLDANRFAELCVALYTQASVWERTHSAAASALEKSCSAEAFQSTISALIGVKQ